MINKIAAHSCVIWVTDVVNQLPSQSSELKVELGTKVEYVFGESLESFQQRMIKTEERQL